MRLSRVRFTVRQTMIAVAGVGLLFGGAVETRRRRERFDNLASYHWRKYPGRFCSFTPQRLSPHDEWHGQMSRKYSRAASYPWFPVASDPPPPLDTRKSPCLCDLQFSASHPGLMRDFLEREGWETNCGELEEDANRFLASAYKGEGRIEAEGATEDDAWQKLFDRARALGVRLPTESRRSDSPAAVGRSLERVR